ncbi:hypothetical protein CKA38_00040 [Ereboglobus luteus]|uniref:Dystroglycan-type cadherin-like domain-containing protein n=1 Tax=Ereboglobus luteus TaxID=1796921 RepID=A0A2U8E6D1_9BACT|nr:hypothetical protein CKA38_00040 [Ereboglobus luteus]
MTAGHHQPAHASGTIGEAFTYTIVASNNPASYDAIGLPSGLSINTASGVISGTATAAGTSNVTISANQSWRLRFQDTRNHHLRAAASRQCAGHHQFTRGHGHGWRGLISNRRYGISHGLLRQPIACRPVNRLGERPHLRHNFVLGHEHHRTWRNQRCRHRHCHAHT